MKVGGVGTKALIDSGSQITVLSQSWVENNLSQEIQALPEDLTIVGAGGHQVPFLGIVPVNIELPESLTGIKGIVDVWAFVCPNTSVPVIIGTNTFKHYANLGRKEKGDNFLQGLRLNCMSHFVYTEACQDSQGKLGTYRAQRRKTIIPPGGLTDIWCNSKFKVPSTRGTILIQGKESLQNGILVVSQKIDVLTTNTNVLKITLMNTTDHDVIIKKGERIADAYLVDKEYCISSVVQM